MRKRSYVLPCRTNAAVVPEKYRSASCDAHAANDAGSVAGRWGVDSTLITKHRAQIGFEDGRRVLQLVRHAGQVLQLADGLLGLPHAVGGGVDLAAQEIGILPIDRHLGESLDFSLDAIELEGDELGVLFRARVVVQPQLSHRDAVLQRLDDPLVAASLRRLERLAHLGEARDQLGLLRRAQKPIERGLRTEQAKKQPQQAVEPGGANLFTRTDGLSGG